MRKYSKTCTESDLHQPKDNTDWLSISIYLAHARLINLLILLVAGQFQRYSFRSSLLHQIFIVSQWGKEACIIGDFEKLISIGCHKI